MSKWTKGKQFESAVEILEWGDTDNPFIMHITGDILNANKVVIGEFLRNYSNYYQAIEEKEDEVREFWLWDYCNEHGWRRTDGYYCNDFKDTEGNKFNLLKEVPDSKKRKIESSKIRVRMSDLTIVEDEK